MSTVYQNALITISATSSKSGTEGLFRRCPEYEISFLSKDDELFTYIFSGEREHFDGHLCTGSLAQVYPLLNRAWAFQERLLSPRVLHFGRSELIFECVEPPRCECADIRNTFHWFFLVEGSKRQLAFKDPHTQTPAELWRHMIRQHSHLQLTFPGDKLVTLAGLAKRLAGPDDQYLAGLWRNSLVGDLHWRITYPQDVRSRPEWRAPSWSWASVEGTITHWGPYLYFRPNRIDDPAISAQLIDYQIVPKTTDEYGELQSGKIQLLASCASVVWEQRTGQRGYVESYVVFPDGQEREFFLDALVGGATTHGPQVVHVETVCVLLYHNSEFRTALVLRRSESDQDVFERIGLLSEELRDQCGYEVGETIGVLETLEDTWSLYPREKRIVTIV